MNPESIKAKLLNISKSEKEVFQELLNRYGSEQFLARLSQSAYADKFIFKGGSLLTYLIDSKRKTRDLDFSIRHISNQVSDATQIIQEITKIELNDGLMWSKPEGKTLEHPTMDYPGVRLKCPFKLGGAKGFVHMDLAIGDEVEAVKRTLKRIRYKDKPFIGPDFNLFVYPPETIFSEKLQIAMDRGIKNTRMKDYYDLYKMIQLDVLHTNDIKQSIRRTFEKREMQFQPSIDFDEQTQERLQVYWSAFLRKLDISDAPTEISEVILVIDRKLKDIYGL